MFRNDRNKFYKYFSLSKKCCMNKMFVNIFYILKIWQLQPQSKLYFDCTIIYYCLKSKF